MISQALSNGQNHASSNGQKETSGGYKLYPRRFAVLAIFCACSLSNGFQWIEYVIIQNIIVRYYNESLPDSYVAKNNAVTWTSLSYMVIQTIEYSMKFIIVLIGDIYSINVSSYVVVRSIWYKINMFYWSFSQCIRSNNKML